MKHEHKLVYMFISDILECVHTFKLAFLSVCPLAQAYSDRFKHFVSIHKILCRNDPTYITYNYVRIVLTFI